MIFKTNISLDGGKPLKMVLVVIAWQGFENVDSVTEWPGAKVNSTASPGAAVRVSGVKTSPFLPTATWWMLDAEAAAAAVVVAAVVVVVVEEEADDAGAPYWANVLERVEAMSSREK